MKAYSCRQVKNDELAARDLADLLRMGRLAEAWIARPEIRELREITRYAASWCTSAPAARTRCTAWVRADTKVIGANVAYPTAAGLLGPSGRQAVAGGATGASGRRGQRDRDDQPSVLLRGAPGTMASRPGTWRCRRSRAPCAAARSSSWERWRSPGSPSGSGSTG